MMMKMILQQSDDDENVFYNRVRMMKMFQQSEDEDGNYYNRMMVKILQV